jgi:hypothetical protein
MDIFEEIVRMRRAGQRGALSDIFVDQVTFGPTSSTIGSC